MWNFTHVSMWGQVCAPTIHKHHCIHANSPGLSRSLPDTALISRTKSSFELSCALVWDLAHFKLKTSIFQFLGHFCMYLVTDKDYFWHQNDDCEIWYKTSYNVLSHSHWGQHQFVGGGGGSVEIPGGSEKRRVSRGWHLCHCKFPWLWGAISLLTIDILVSNLASSLMLSCFLVVSGCTENHFYSLPFGQAEASIY